MGLAMLASQPRFAALNQDAAIRGALDLFRLAGSALTEDSGRVAKNRREDGIDKIAPDEWNEWITKVPMPAKFPATKEEFLKVIGKHVFRGLKTREEKIKEFIDSQEEDLPQEFPDECIWQGWANRMRDFKIEGLSKVRSVLGKKGYKVRKANTKRRKRGGGGLPEHKFHG